MARKSSGLRVYNGRPFEQATAATNRSTGLAPRAVRPAAMTDADTRPYGRDPIRQFRACQVLRSSTSQRMPGARESLASAVRSG